MQLREDEVEIFIRCIAFHWTCGEWREIELAILRNGDHLVAVGHISFDRFRHLTSVNAWNDLFDPHQVERVAG